MNLELMPASRFLPDFLALTYEYNRLAQKFYKGMCNAVNGLVLVLKGVFIEHANRLTGSKIPCAIAEVVIEANDS